MIDIVNINPLINGSVFKTNLFLKDNIILVEDNICSDLSRTPKTVKYKGIKRISYSELIDEEYQFKYQADLVSMISSEFTIYYATVNNKMNGSTLYINRVNCEYLNEEFVIKIELCEKNEALVDSFLIGLNNRYSILIIPDSKLVFDRPFLKEVLLIDANEKKTYDITRKESEIDDFFRLKEAWIMANSRHIAFKTGRITTREKRLIWNRKKHESVFLNSHNHIESIAVSDINEFIKNIKDDNQIDPKIIIDKGETNKSISVISFNDNNINYSVESFEAKSTDIKAFNTETRKTKIISINNSFDLILHFNKDFYGILLTEDRKFEIYNIFENKRIFCTNEYIVFIDEEVVITCRPQKRSLNRIFSVYDLKSSKVIKSIESRFSEFDYEKNILILY